MKYLIAVLFVLSISCKQESNYDCNYIENYYQSIYLADIEFETKNYQKAFELYQEAFDSCEPINIPTINEFGNFAELCAILGKNDLAIEFIKKNIKRGYEIKWLQQDSIFNGLFASEEGVKLLANYDKLREEALSELNLELRNEIQKMSAEDQRYRGGNYQENIDKQEAIDEKNTLRIIEIFEEIGYPSEAIIGSFSVDNSPADISGILLHTSDSIRMNYFVPILKTFVKNGKCPPTALGTIIDQYYLYNGEPQIYGTYGKMGGEYSNMIDDLKQVDKNRISIGLPPLKLKEKKDSILLARNPHLFN